MKRLIEIAFLFVFASGLAQAHTSGGVGGGSGYTVVLNPVSHVIYFPGHLDDRFDVVRQGAQVTPGMRPYYLDANDFVILQNAQDTRATFEAKGADGSTKSYRIMSGDQTNQVELIDRRATIRRDAN